MTEEKKEQKAISRKSRLYASLIFLIAFVVTTILWIVIYAPLFQPNENAIIILIFFLVLGGLAAFPWLPVLFPREPPGGLPLEDL
jgi:hypothetical protein